MSNLSKYTSPTKESQAWKHGIWAETSPASNPAHSRAYEGTNFVYSKTKPKSSTPSPAPALRRRPTKLAHSSSLPGADFPFREKIVKSRGIMLDPLSPTRSPSKIKSRELSFDVKSPSTSPTKSPTKSRALEKLEKFRDTTHYIPMSDNVPAEGEEEQLQVAMFPQVIAAERTRLFALERQMGVAQRKLMERANEISPLEWVTRARELNKSFSDELLEYSKELPQHKRVIARLLKGYEHVTDALMKMVHIY